MKKIELKIELDPVTDGATITSDNPVSKEDGALVISTTGESRIVDQDEANEILERLTGKSTCEYLGSTDYLMIYNRDKIINAEDGRYFMGSAIIFNGTIRGIEMLTEDDYSSAATEFESRLVTLAADGERFKAFPIP